MESLKVRLALRPCLQNHSVIRITQLIPKLCLSAKVLFLVRSEHFLCFKASETVITTFLNFSIAIIHIFFLFFFVFSLFFVYLVFQVSRQKSKGVKH